MSSRRTESHSHIHARPSLRPSTVCVFTPSSSRSTDLRDMYHCTNGECIPCVTIKRSPCIRSPSRLRPDLFSARRARSRAGFRLQCNYSFVGCGNCSNLSAFFHTCLRGSFVCLLIYSMHIQLTTAAFGCWARCRDNELDDFEVGGASVAHVWNLRK